MATGEGLPEAILSIYIQGFFMRCVAQILPIWWSAYQSSKFCFEWCWTLSPGHHSVAAALSLSYFPCPVFLVFALKLCVCVFYFVVLEACTPLLNHNLRWKEYFSTSKINVGLQRKTIKNSFFSESLYSVYFSLCSSLFLIFSHSLFSDTSRHTSKLTTKIFNSRSFLPVLTDIPHKCNLINNVPEPFNQINVDDLATHYPILATHPLSSLKKPPS